MKRQTLLQVHTIGALWLLAAACGGGENFAGGEQQTEAVLELQVSAGDFAGNGLPATRATDNEKVTSFENGDRIGVIVLDDSGNALYKNIPYKYNDGSWSFDNGNGEGKAACYYHPKARMYIVYYPYSPDADNIKSETGLKGIFRPKVDQRAKADYRASDLMVWTSSPAKAVKTLDAVLQHAYASVSFSPTIKCKLVTGEDLSYVPPGVSDVNFTIGEDVCYPYQAADGSFRHVIPAGASDDDVRFFCTLEGKTYSTTRSLSQTIAGTRYVVTPVIKDLGEYSLDKAKLGDFYCRSNDGSTGYLIPGDIPSLTDAQQAACLGVVLKVGKDNSGDWKDDCDYKQKDSQTPMSDIHGYVLALNDANNGNDCPWRNNAFGWNLNTNKDKYTGFYGYKNTQIIKKKGEDEGSVRDTYSATYYATENYESLYPAPDNSSGWFLPSAGQCWYWSQNEEILLGNIKKTSENENYSWKSIYWSSSEDDVRHDSNALCLLIRSKNIYDYAKKEYFCVRACLAF